MSSPLRFFLGACVVSILAMLLLSYATQSGPGLSPDSRGYLSAARFMLEGKGISNLNGNGDIVPLTHFAPLYPILLAGTGHGADPLDRARCLSIALFGASILLGGFLVYRATNRSALAGILGAILMAVSYDLLRVYAMVWSEPPFIFFMLLAFLLMCEYLQSLRPILLVLGSVAVACAFVTRYSGASLVIATGLVLLLYRNRDFKRRIIDCVIYSLLSVTPMIIWLVRNLVTAHNAADREAAFHPPNWKDIEVSLITLGDWIVPLEKSAVIPVIVTSIIAIAGAIVIGRMLLRTRSETARRPATSSVESEPRPPGLLLITFCVVYILFLLFSVSFVDAHTPLDYRILSPLYIALLLWLVLVLRPMMRRESLTIALLIILGYFIGSQSARSIVWARETSTTGIGFGSQTWRDSPTLKWIAKLPPNTLLYTNSPDLIDFRVNRFAKPVPKVMNPITRKPEKTYEPYLMGLRDDLVAHGGYIVWFDLRKASRWYLVSEEQFNHDLPVELVKRFSDGRVYQLKAQATEPTTESSSR